MASPAEPVSARRIAALALPALGALAAEPAYLLFDTAVVGRLGAVSLAALAVGALVLALVGSQLTFLSYGTTARAARRFGAGDRAGAVADGVQASWLAAGLGVAIVAVVQVSAVPVARLIAADDAVVAAAVPWLRIAVCGVPAILLALAGNGWLRGVQDTVRPLRYIGAGFGLSALLCPLLVYGPAGLPRLGLAGSAVANLAGQCVAGALFVAALHRERVGLRIDAGVLRAQLGMGRDLIARSLAFQACFVSAAAVAARFGAAALGAHQIVLQLWSFLALVLDSLAIAAQSLVGAALGGAAAGQARAAARRITGYALVAAAVLAGVFAAAAGSAPRLFTGDPAVLAAIGVPWWFLVAQLPVAGVVFALDGVLLGAGDTRFLRTATLLAALTGFLPLTWLSLVFGWGLAGIWAGLDLFVVLRLLLVGYRVRTDRWLTTGGPA